ncbi:hypothetical protein DMN91_004896 [Ooceraea biroi]|uniref:SS18 N-terminal domain-containing protein n=1 Tax=Ooceraea biroi TaxID=2015173 RepID=A0A3L8DS80_OOCBI|nr:hypothetical protein DMN91_004896 [Ooceraea biroi]
MSVTFAQRGRPPPNPAQIQKMLDENCQLIQMIQEYQNKGKAQECVHKYRFNYSFSIHSIKKNCSCH